MQYVYVCMYVGPVAEIVVATPGRLLDLIEEEALSLSGWCMYVCVNIVCMYSSYTKWYLKYFIIVGVGVICFPSC